jgi:hypothetical protein
VSVLSVVFSFSIVSSNYCAMLGRGEFNCVAFIAVLYVGMQFVSVIAVLYVGMQFVSFIAELIIGMLFIADRAVLFVGKPFVAGIVCLQAVCRG